MWRVTAYVLITKIVNGRIQLLVTIGQVPLFQFGAREIVLDFIVISLVVVLLLAVLIGRLADEAPLGALVEKWQIEPVIRP